MTGSVANFGERPTAGQRVADERVAAVMDGEGMKVFTQNTAGSSRPSDRDQSTARRRDAGVNTVVALVVALVDAAADVLDAPHRLAAPRRSWLRRRRSRARRANGSGGGCVPI